MSAAEPLVAREPIRDDGFVDPDESVDPWMNDGETEFPYRALSKSAIASVVLFVMGLVGILVPAVLVLAVVGGFLGWLAIRGIRAYPSEFSGAAIARFGLIANLLLVTGGIAYHWYVYATEVPEGYTRVNFYELQQPDGARDLPTQRAAEVSGQPVFIKGYVHPTSGSGMLRRFIMVPDLGTCCFGGQPKSTDMVSVSLLDGQTVQGNMMKKKLAGKFFVTPADRSTPGFENGIFYRFNVDQIR